MAHGNDHYGSRTFRFVTVSRPGSAALGHGKQHVVRGTIERVYDLGNVVMLWILTAKGWMEPVLLDRRCFQDLLDGERCHPPALIGRYAVHNGSTLLLQENRRGTA